MPCMCHHMEPTARERQSKIVCSLLVTLQKDGHLANLPVGIQEGSRSSYGATSLVDEATALLCKVIPTLPDKYLYNARSKSSRDLLDWWEEHQVLDAKYEEEQAKAKQEELDRREALSKLTTKEKHLLGL